MLCPAVREIDEYHAHPDPWLTSLLLLSYDAQQRGNADRATYGKSCEST